MQESLEGKCVLVTGAARRIGAAIVKRLHGEGAPMAIHSRGSANAMSSSWLPRFVTSSIN